MTGNDCYSKIYFRRSGSNESSIRERPHFMDFHLLKARGEGEYPGHIHDKYEMIYVLTGQYRCRINDCEMTLSPRQLLLIKPGDYHQDHFQRGQRHFVLHFELKENLFSQGIAVEDQLIRGPVEGIVQIFHELERESTGRGGDLFSPFLQDALLETLFWRIAREFPPLALSDNFRLYSKKRIFSARLYNLFGESLNKPLPVEQMAGELGMTRRTLSRECRRLLGSSPAELFLDFRLGMAETLLKRGDRSVKEVCHELGFDSPFNFSRAFFRVKGIRPSDITP